MLSLCCGFPSSLYPRLLSCCSCAAAVSPVLCRYIKGFAWYRAWVVKCHPNDTFDVRFTRPPSSPSEGTTPRKGAAAAREQRPKMEMSSQASGSEEDWNSDEEVSRDVASKQGHAYSCDTMAALVGLHTVEKRTSFGVSRATERQHTQPRERTWTTYVRTYGIPGPTGNSSLHPAPPFFVAFLTAELYLGGGRRVESNVR